MRGGEIKNKNNNTNNATNKKVKQGNTLRHTKAITYFCKESFEEFPVLEVDVVKREGG